MEKSTRGGSNNQKGRTGTSTTKKGRPVPLIVLGIFGKLIGTVILVLILVGCILGGLVGGGVYGIVKSTPPLDPNALKIQNFNSFVYDADGNIVAELKRDENRVWIDYQDIPQQLIEAYVAIEDKRFFEHDGVDYKRVAGAFLSYAKKFVQKDTDISGGSTITQQLIKNLTGNNEVTIKRKLQEQWQAVQLEKGLSKEEILTLYLNTVPMGSTFYGVETAAKGYFAKDVRDLTLSECASLAGITNWTVKYMPNSPENIEANLERRDLILDQMLEQGLIEQDEYETAINEKIRFQYNPQAGKVMKTSTQSYFVDEAIRSVKTALMAQYEYSEQTALDMIYNTGMHIHTTLNPKVQAIMDDAYQNPEFFTDENPNTDELPQSAMVIMNPKTGYVEAMYGGRGEKEGSVFNRASQAERSPGSSIKPLVVYAPGLESKTITAATVVDDVPQYLNGKTPDKQWPRNVEKGNYGLTGVREGLYRSRNVVATLLLINHVGFDYSLDYLAKVGIDRKNERYGSIAMGGFTKGMTPLEMAAGYQVFANKGVYTKPIFFTTVVDNNGKTLLDNIPERTQVYSEDTIFIMDSLMTDTVQRGTAYPYGIIKYKTETTDADGKKKETTVTIPTAGKTGTTDETKDKWFCGFSDYYVGVVWYGYDQAVSMSYTNSEEHSAALRIWNEVMTKVHSEQNLTAKPLFEDVPPNIVKVSVCAESGLLPNENCALDPRGSQVYSEYFIKGTEPTTDEVCTTHYATSVCTASLDELGRPLLATTYCPAETTQTGIHIHRPVPYTKLFPTDKPPTDYTLEIQEGEYCTVHSAATVNPTPPPVDPNAPVDPGSTPVDPGTQTTVPTP